MTSTGSLAQVLKRIKASEAKIVTPRLDAWLIAHPEGIVVPPSMMPVVEALLSGPNSDRTARFGASARGTCERRQVFSFLGMPTLGTMDSVLQNLFNDGTWRHIRWQLTLLLAEIATDVEVRHTLPEYHTRVSTDAENTIEGWGLELKGHGWMGGVMKDGLPPAHMLQVHTYFLATGYDKFVYIAEDKRSNDWTEIIVRPSKAWMQVTKDELNALASAVEDEILPKVLPACRAGTGTDFQRCPFRNDCRSQQDWPSAGKWGSP